LLSFLGGVLFLFLTNYLTVTIPTEIGAAIDAGAAAAAGPHILAVGLMGVAVILVRTLSRVLVFNPGRDIEYQLRSDLFDALLAQQPSFYATRSTGDLVSRGSSDLTFVRAMVGFGFMQVVNVTFAVLLTGWRMLTLSPSLTLGAVLPLIVGLVVVNSAVGKVFNYGRLAQQQLGQVSDQVLTSFQGVATIQGFVAKDAFLQRFDEKCEALLRTRVATSLLGAFAFPALVLAGSISVFVVLFVGGPMAVRGELSVGDIAAFATLLGVLLPPLRSIGWMLSVIQTGLASLTRIFEILDAPVERPEGDRPEAVPGGGGPGFTVRGLSFAYPDAPERRVLDGLSLDIRPGTVVGIFGRTGSGKTSLLRLLARLYNAPEGSIVVSGPDGSSADLSRLDLRAWRRSLSMAPQRPFLFSDTITENVALSEPVDPSAVREAVDKAALAIDLAALPDGLRTVVGERGIMLSGGQRQRVALARAMYRRSDLILLDDVLSAVDHETEARLLLALRALGDGRERGRPTVLIVSHRVSALRDADHVFVLDQGRLVDEGRPDDLFQRPGLFREAWLGQTPADEELSR
jgi:ATP-binding cassette subfamily B protein